MPIGMKSRCMSAMLWLAEMGAVESKGEEAGEVVGEVYYDVQLQGRRCKSCRELGCFVVRCRPASCSWWLREKAGLSRILCWKIGVVRVYFYVLASY